jgi:hypothetical protein
MSYRLWILSATMPDWRAGRGEDNAVFTQCTLYSIYKTVEIWTLMTF